MRNLETWVELKKIDKLYIGLSEIDLATIEHCFQVVKQGTQIVILDAYDKLKNIYQNHRVSQIEWDRDIEKVGNEPSQPKVRNGSILVKVNSNYTRVKFDEIEYISSEGKFVKIALKDKLLTTRSQLKNVAKILPENFLMVHRSYLLNIDKVDSINVNDMEVVMESYKIPFSRKHKQDLLGNFQLSA